MKIMGVDQAFNHSSYAIFDNNEYITSDNYIVCSKEEKKALKKADETLSDEEKYTRFYNFLKRGIDEHDPDLIICEAAYCGPNKRVFGLISQLIGMIRGICFETGRKFEVVPTATYRSKLGIPNKKDAAVNLVNMLYPDVEIDDESDIADAICLAMYGSIISDKI